MKKSIIIVILIGSLIGLRFGQIIFKNYKGKEYLNETGNIYYIQYGVYTSNEAALKNSSSLDNYKIVENDDKYYVYYGITKDLDNYEKIAGNMKELGYDNYREEIVVSSKSFLETLEQYDMLLRETTDNSIVNAICNQVLTSYEELVLNGSEN